MIPNQTSTDPAASGLRQVLYISRATSAVTDAEIKKILNSSRRNNRRSDITGCLLVTDRHFVQVLEGDGQALSALVARIATDPRHGEVRVFVDRQVAQRRYPDWSMGLLYRLEVADRIEALLAGDACSPDAAFGLLTDVSPDSVLGKL